MSGVGDDHDKPRRLDDDPRPIGGSNPPTLPDEELIHDRDSSVSETYGRPERLSDQRCDEAAAGASPCSAPYRTAMYFAIWFRKPL